MKGAKHQKINQMITFIWDSRLYKPTCTTDSRWMATRLAAMESQD